MELVYLWVENYKNIKNQGFNFSPRFECKYNQDTKELTIDENKDYVSIFPENINITAIVGENGSGKTSILEEIMTTMPRILIYFIANEFQILGSKSVINNTHFKYRPIKQNIIENILHINSDMIKLDKVEDFFSYVSIRSQYSNKNWQLGNEGLDKINLTKYIRSINSLIMKNFDLLDSNFFRFNPTFIQIYKISTEKNSDLIDKIKPFSEKGLVEMSSINLQKDEFKAFSELIFEDIISVDIKDEKKRTIYELSQGERKSFIDYLLFFNYLTTTEKSILLLDEPDLTIHPIWQRNYLNDLIHFSKKIGKKIHFIITSHSPFLISDLPKENVIFLEKYKKDEDKNQKEGNCKIATPDINQTFGANIHTLLSNGFFMSDGLMGKFAKNKINEIKKFYELIQKLQNKGKIKNKNLWKKSYERRKTRFGNIQKIIGEPFLQSIIKNYLDELEIIFNGKKEFLDREIKRLQVLQESLND